jgi:hypothetical protein
MNVNGKLRTFETAPGSGREGSIKKNDGRGEFNYDIV